MESPCEQCPYLRQLRGLKSGECMDDMDWRQSTVWDILRQPFSFWQNITKFSSTTISPSKTKPVIVSSFNTLSTKKRAGVGVQKKN
jgi:hypothetical protein